MYEETVKKETVFNGRIMRIEVLDIELPDGRRASREIVRHGPAAAVIAQRNDGRFIFIRQFRKALDRICFEVMAGNCDPGEDSETTAVRELKEETGYTADSICSLGRIYPSVGYCDECIDIFYVEVNEEPGGTNFDRDENIETLLLTEKEMDEQIRTKKVQDAKTLSAWMLYKLMAPSDRPHC